MNGSLSITIMGDKSLEIKAWNKVTGVDCIMLTKYSTFYPSLLLPSALLNPGVASDLPWLIRCGKKDVCHLQAEALGASTCLPRLFFLWTSWLPVVRREAAPSAWAPERRQCGTKAPPNHDGHTVWIRKNLVVIRHCAMGSFVSANSLAYPNTVTQDLDYKDR